ncbi:MAG: hypothetical protein QXO71_10550 [Candidatus Jordarchaeaceae archaeon]
MSEDMKDTVSENSESNENDELIEFDEDYSPKRGLTFIFASAGFSIFILAILTGLEPYLIRKITGSYSQFIPYGYYYTLNFICAIVATCVTALIAVY